MRTCTTNDYERTPLFLWLSSFPVIEHFIDKKLCSKFDRFLDTISVCRYAARRIVTNARIVYLLRGMCNQLVDVHRKYVSVCRKLYLTDGVNGLGNWERWRWWCGNRIRKCWKFRVSCRTSRDLYSKCCGWRLFINFTLQNNAFGWNRLRYTHDAVMVIRIS